MTFQLRTRKRARNESPASPDAVRGEIHGRVLGSRHDAFSRYARPDPDVRGEMIGISLLEVQMLRAFVDEDRAFQAWRRRARGAAGGAAAGPGNGTGMESRNV